MPASLPQGTAALKRLPMRTNTVARGMRRPVPVLPAVATWNAYDMRTSMAAPGTMRRVLMLPHVVT